MSCCTICMKERDCELCKRTIRFGEIFGVETNEQRFRDGTIYRDVRLKCSDCFEWRVKDLLRLLFLSYPEAHASFGPNKPTRWQKFRAALIAMQMYVCPLTWDVRNRCTGEIESRHHTRKGAHKAIFSRGRSAVRSFEVVRHVFRTPASHYMATQTILMNRAMRYGPRPYQDGPILPARAQASAIGR
jgi:hypothetical protein